MWLSIGCNIVLPNGNQYRTEGQIRIDCILDYPRHSHGRSTNKIAVIVVAGRQDGRLTNDQFAIEMFVNPFPQPEFKLWMELLDVDCINAAIHKAKAVSWAYNSIGFGACKNIADTDLKIRIITEELLPLFS